MNSTRIEYRDNGYFIVGTRVSLDSIVYAYLRGDSSQGIAESFAALNRDQIDCALAFYIGNRDTVDRYLAQGRAEFQNLRREAHGSDSRLRAKLTETKQRIHAPSGVSQPAPRFQQTPIRTTRLLSVA